MISGMRKFSYVVVTLGCALACAPLVHAQGSSAEGSIVDAFLLPRNPVSGDVAWIGAGLIWLLIALSVASLGWIGAMAWANRRKEIVPDDLWASIDELVRERKFQEVYDLAKLHQSDMARILTVALAESAHGYGAMVRAAEQSCEQLAIGRLRRIEPLNIVGSVAPMIGLFGTVYGMIIAFQEIVAAGGTPDPVGLASGIGTALTTTFWGLVVAIPALAGYALIRNKIDGLTIEAAASAEHIIGLLRPTPAHPPTAAQESG
jgi:biopolymer transport protein ExbB